MLRISPAHYPAILILEIQNRLRECVFELNPFASIAEFDKLKIVIINRISGVRSISRMEHNLSDAQVCQHRIDGKSSLS